MTERRWQAGDDYWCDGIHYRVVPGKKGPDDLRLEKRIDGDWTPVKMETGIMLADFFFENEHVLYPRTKGYRGGFEYLKALHNATRDGWEAVARGINAQRAARVAGRALQGCLPVRYRGDGK